MAKMQAFFVGLMAVLAAELVLAGEAYRLQPGDSVAIYVDGALSLGRAQTVGADGAAPVVFAGYVPVAGLTATEAQARIRGELTARGLYADPDVLVVVEAYRPIYVSGVVASPGAYPHAGEMTVARAVALAGGPRTIEQDGAASPIAVFQYYNAISGLAEARRGHLRATLALQRLEAQIAGAAAPDFRAPEGLDLDAATIEAAIAAERDRFTLTVAQSAEEEALLSDSIGLLESEIGTVVSRRAELAALVEVLSEETQSAQSLLSRGLRTQTTVVQSQRTLSLSRVDLLEMERAQTAAQQRLAQARQDLRDAPRQRQLALGAERDARLDEVASTRERILAFGRQIALFPGLIVDGATGEPTLAYEVHRGAGETLQRIDANPDFVLAPGDLLVVRALTLAN